MSQSQSTEETIGGMAPAPMGVNGARVDQSAFIAQPNQTTGTTGQQDAPDFLKVFRCASAATAMSAEGSKYVRELREHLKTKATKLNIEVTSLPYPAETLAIVCGDNAFLLLFSEANRRDENLPTVALTQSALQTMRSSLGSNIKMRNCIVVTPQDYCKVEVMGAHIINSFSAISSSEILSLDIRSLKHYQLEVSTNRSVFDDFVRRTDPHGVPARADLCMTISVNMPKHRNNQNVPQDLFSQAEYEKAEIAAIGAYVTFVNSPDGTGMPKFLPEVHISHITLALPMEGSLPMLLALATDTLIDSGYWKSQFSELGGTQQANIGNLFQDPSTGGPIRCENLIHRDQLILNYMRPPVLILDVVEGRARIPGLEQYAIANSNGHIVESYNKFLVNSNIPATTQVARWFCQEYDGFVSVGGTPSDSRWVDYLNMMIHHSNSKAQCDMLNMHFNRPDDMVQVKRGFCSDLTLHYVNNMVLLDPQVLRGVQQAVHQAIRTVNGNTTSGSVDLSMLLAASQSFMASPTGVNYGGVTSSPFCSVYAGTSNPLF